MRTVILLFLILPILSYSQCTIKDILPFDHNITKFEAIIKSQLLRGFSDDEPNNLFQGSWKKPDYRKDSVFKDEQYFTSTYNNCFTFKESRYRLKFADDKLYDQELTIEVKANEYNKCIEIYNKFVTLFKSEYLFAQDYVTQDEETNAQLGKGIWFTNKTDDDLKLKQISVSYRIQYTVIWNSATFKPMRTNNIDSYLIKVESVDLTETKLDSRGY